MTGMPQIQSIRRMRRNGESIAAIARRQHVSEPTVRKYLRMDDLSEKPPVRKRRGSVIDPYLPLIGQWLAEDRASWRKQRHTATRIWERLRDEHGAEVSLSTVTRAVARLRRESAVEPGGSFMDLVWHPGEAQADFGEVDVLYRGAPQRVRHFVLDFPYSNVGLAQLMPGENAECTCQAPLDLFEWLGGVPERIVFDNAAGVGRRTGGGGRPLDPPVPGVPGALRVRELPVLAVRRTREGRGRGEGRHGPAQAVRVQAVRVEPGELQLQTAGQVPGARREAPPRQGRGGGRPVRGGPRGPASPARETFRRGHVEAHEDRQVRRGHARRQAPLLHGRVARASRRARGPARPRDRDPRRGGTRLAVHPRAYGQASTSSEDPSMQLAMLCNRPNAWRNSLVRDMPPDPLREWLDRQDERERRGALQTLKRVDGESGWANAVEAMLATLESTGGVGRAGVTLLAARLAEGVERVEYEDDRPDLSEYDIAFTATDTEGGE